MPVPVPLLEACGVRLHERANPNLVPFQIQVYLNGREWLAQQMKREGIKYQRRENCFPWIEDYGRAQTLLDVQRETEWPQQLGAIAGQLNPAHAEIFADFPAAYYWSTIESEWATDVGFRGSVELRRLFPLWVEQGITSFSSGDVMRYLGHKVYGAGEVHGRFAGEICTDLKRRQEGVRIKHRMDRNSVKMYDKAHTAAGSVLRVEMTMNNEKAFRVFRPAEGDPAADMKWRRMRRGLADLHRRGTVAQQINDRYLDALASVDDSRRLQQILEPIEKPIRWKGRPVRALHPFSAEDGALLRIINQGDFMVHGISNKALRSALFPHPPATPAEAKRRSAQISRKLRLLRAHGILRKILRPTSLSGHRIRPHHSLCCPDCS